MSLTAIHSCIMLPDFSGFSHKLDQYHRYSILHISTRLFKTGFLSFYKVNTLSDSASFIFDLFYLLPNMTLTTIIVYYVVKFSTENAKHHFTATHSLHRVNKFLWLNWRWINHLFDERSLTVGVGC